MSEFEVENLDKTLNQTLDETLEECFNEINSTQENNQENNDDIEVNDTLSQIDNESDENIDINLSEDEEIEDDENVIELTFDQLLSVINEKYFDLLNKIYKIYENHETLSKSIEFDIEYLKEKLENNENSVLNLITDNYLYCLEQIKDKNSDYFIYQKEKIIRKKSNSKGSVKIIKNKITKIGNKTLFKNVLENLKRDTIMEIFNDILEIFKLLIYEDDNVYNFHEDYLEYVNENFKNNKNFNKMLVVVENIDLLIGSLEEDEIEEAEYQERIESSNKDKKKNKKKSKKSEENVGEEFIKGIENTKIAQMAKNISEKINLEDFPILTDPSKLLSTLTNPEEGLGSVGGLMDVVMKEVQSSFKDGNSGENDLINEAQDIMGKLNGTDLDPMKIMKNMNLDLDKMGDLFKK